MSNTIKNIKVMQVLLAISVFLGGVSGFFIINMVHNFDTDHQLVVTVSKIVFLIIWFSIICILGFCFMNLEDIMDQIRKTEQMKDKTIPEVKNSLEEQTKVQENERFINSETDKH